MKDVKERRDLSILFSYYPDTFIIVSKTGSVGIFQFFLVITRGKKIVLGYCVRYFQFFLVITRS